MTDPPRCFSAGAREQLMHACRPVLVFVLLMTAVATPFAAKSASLRVGIEIVEACDVRTSGPASASPGSPVAAKCASGTPYSIALQKRSIHDDGRSRPAIVPDDGTMAPAGFQIATFTL